MMKTPKRIWLIEDREDPDCITWDGNQPTSNDGSVEYIRADEADTSHDVGFPILRIIENKHLRNGAIIEVRNGKVCLIRADGQIVGRGDTLQGLLTELIFILC